MGGLLAHGQGSDGCTQMVAHIEVGMHHDNDLYG